MIRCGYFLGFFRGIGAGSLDRKYFRKYPRIPIDFSVQFNLDGVDHRERASALGGGGLFLNFKGLVALNMGTEITVHFRPAKHFPLIEAKSRVCYVVPGQGVAIEFTEINAEHQRLILQFIHNKIGKRRKHPRASFATQIECKECMTLAFARDISVGGMFVETDQPMPVGSRLNLRFNLEDQAPITVAAAEVTYQVGKMGVGVQFVDVAPEDLKRIESYVAKSKPSADISN